MSKISRLFGVSSKIMPALLLGAALSTDVSAHNSARSICGDWDRDLGRHGKQKYFPLLDRTFESGNGVACIYRGDTREFAWDGGDFPWDDGPSRLVKAFSLRSETGTQGYYKALGAATEREKSLAEKARIEEENAYRREVKSKTVIVNNYYSKPESTADDDSPSDSDESYWEGLGVGIITGIIVDSILRKPGSGHGHGHGHGSHHKHNKWPIHGRH